MFNLVNVSLTINKKQRLKETRLSFAEEKMTTLIGHNGCGKSTLLQLLAKQYVPTSGHIEYKQKNLTQWAPTEFAKEVAYLPQYLAAPAGITLEQLVEFGRYPHQNMFHKVTKEEKELIHESLMHVGLYDLKDKYLTQVSGGERQRAWIAMMLAQNCSCMILDEPTSALDLKYQYELLNLLRTLQEKQRLTVILVLHDINLAAEFSHQIISCRQGRIVHQSSPMDMLNTKKLHQIFGVDFDFIDIPSRSVPMSYVRN